MKRDYNRHLWCVYDKLGQCWPWTLAHTRQGAIRETGGDWDYSYRGGLRCRKVTVVDGWQDVTKEGE